MAPSSAAWHSRSTNATLSISSYFAISSILKKLHSQTKIVKDECRKNKLALFFMPSRILSYRKTQNLLPTAMLAHKNKIPTYQRSMLSSMRLNDASYHRHIFYRLLPRNRLHFICHSLSLALPLPIQICYSLSYKSYLSCILLHLTTFSNPLYGAATK